MTRSWKPGNKIVAPNGAFVASDPNKASRADNYKLLINAIIPRPIAFVSTINKAGQVNLAPFSFFNAVASEPPTLMIAISRKRDGDKKDTLRNIEETGEFVVNLASDWLIDALVHCAAEYPYGVDEMQKVGLTPAPSLHVKPPRVKEAAVQFECSIIQTLTIGDAPATSTAVVFGKIVQYHVLDAVMLDGKISPQLLQPIGRLGGISYTKLGEVFDIAIPKV